MLVRVPHSLTVSFQSNSSFKSLSISFFIHSLNSVFFLSKNTFHPNHQIYIGNVIILMMMMMTITNTTTEQQQRVKQTLLLLLLLPSVHPRFLTHKIAVVCCFSLSDSFLFDNSLYSTLAHVQPVTISLVLIKVNIRFSK